VSSLQNACFIGRFYPVSAADLLDEYAYILFCFENFLKVYPKRCINDIDVLRHSLHRLTFLKSLLIIFDSSVVFDFVIFY